MKAMIKKVRSLEGTCGNLDFGTSVREICRVGCGGGMRKIAG